MNQNSGKPSSRIARAGIAKFRPLTPSEQSSKSSAADLPNGWYFNEPKEKDFWKDMEASITPERQNIIEEKNKKSDYMSQVGETANRLQNIITKIDDIDQSTLLEMMEIGDEMENTGDSDPNRFLDDSKTQIVSYLTEIDELAQGQKTLVENLGIWFDSLTKNDQFFESEQSNQPEEPNTQEVYQYLHNIIDDYLEKSEKAQFLHNDVSDFWKKQTSTFKRILAQKDCEIRKLKEIVEQAEQQKQKKSKQKQTKKQNQEEVTQLNGQIATQLRMIEEQKGTIEKLKKQLQASEATAAMSFISNQPIKENPKLSNDLASTKFEFETKISMLNQQIDHLQTENQNLTKSLSEMRIENKHLHQEKDNQELILKELESKNQKALKLLALEQQKPQNEIPAIQNNDVNEKICIELEETIENLKVSHKKALIEQEEFLKSKFLVEKNKLIDAISSDDNMKNLINDYETQIFDQQRKMNDLYKELTETFSNRLLNLTNKYEQRIDLINKNHEYEMRKCNERVNYEIEKKSIEIEEGFNNQLVIELRQRNDREGQKIDHLTAELEKTTNHLNLIKKSLEKYHDQLPDLKTEIDLNLFNQKQSNESNELNSNESTENDFKDQVRHEIDQKQFECDLISKNVLRFELIKEEYENQSNWLLEKQKQFLLKEFEKERMNDQFKLKTVLTKLMENLANVESEVSLNDCIQSISDVYSTLNDILIENNEKEVTIPIEEVKKRIQTYQNRIDQIKSSLDIKSTNNNQQEIEENIDSNQFNVLTINSNLKNDLYNSQYQNQFNDSNNWDLVQSTVFHYEPVNKISVQRSCPHFYKKIKPKICLARSKSQIINIKPMSQTDITDIRVNCPQFEIRTVANSKTVDSKQLTVNSNKPSIFTQLDSAQFSQQKRSVLHHISAQTNPPRLRFHSFFIINMEPIPQRPITPDLETTRMIEDLEQKLKELTQAQKSDDVRNDMFTQMRISIIDSSNKIIQKQKQTIAELLNRKPEIVYQTQIVNVPSVSLDPIERPSKPIYRLDPSSIPSSVQFKPIPMNQNESKEETIEPQKEIEITQDDNIQQKTGEIITNSSNNIQNFKHKTGENQLRNKLKIVDLITLNDEETNEDPFTSSIQLIASHIRFLTSLTENDNLIMNTFRNDLNAYDAFLELTECKDESSYQFLSQIRGNSENFEFNSSSINKLFNSELKLLKILKKSKKKFNAQQHQIQDLQLKLTEKEINSQKQILNDVKKPENSPLRILQTLKHTLETVQNLSNSDNTSLIKKIDEKIQDCENNNYIDQGEIEKLVNEVQIYMNSLQPKTPVIDNSNDLHKEIDKIKDSKNKYKKKYQQECEKNEGLKNQLKTLQNRLNDEKDLNENAVSIYQSNIAMLKELFNTLQLSDQSKDSANLTAMVKNEVLSLQSLLETATSERDIFRNKANDLEDMVDYKDKQLTKLLNELNELEKANGKLEIELRKFNEEQIFFKTDLDILKKEKDLNLETGTKNLSQLQAVIAENTFINKQMYEMKNNEIKQKTRIRELEIAKEEVEVKLALSRYTIEKKETKSIETQTVLRIASQPKPKTSLLTEPGNIIENVAKNSEYQTLNKIEIKKNFEVPVNPHTNTPRSNKHNTNNQIQNNSPISNNSPKIHQITVGKIDQEIPEQQIVNDNQIVLFREEDEEEQAVVVDQEEVEWQLSEMPISNDTDIFNDKIIELNENKEKFYSIEDRPPEKVHQPLDYKQKGKNKKLPNFFTQTVTRPQTSHARPISKPVENDLSIGQTIQGQRALPGQFGRIKPTINNRTAIAMKAALSPHATPKQVLPIKSARNYKFNDNNRPTNNTKAIHKEQVLVTQKQNDETIIITHADFIKNEVENNKKLIIQPIDQTHIFNDHSVANCPNVYLEQRVGIDELEKIITKLQQKIRQLSKIIEEKESENNELKKKFAETYKTTQQQEMKIVRLTSNNKRTEIRSENLQARIDLLVTEISIRNDENFELKKEIQKLRKISQPTSKISIDMKNSQMKKLLLKREKAKQQVLLKSALNAIGATNDKTIQKHMSSLLQNTQRSIARIEAKKRQYKENEQKQIFMALSALSLINDTKISNETLSKLNSSVSNKVYSIKASSINHIKTEDSYEHTENYDLARKFPSTHHALEVMDKVDALNEDEKLDIVNGEMKSETWNKIVQFDKDENTIPELSGNKLDL